MSGAFPAPVSPPQAALESAIGNLLSRVRALEAVVSTGGGGAGIQFGGASPVYGDDNVGDWLVVETTDPTTQDFTEPYATRHDLSSGYGSGLNINNGLLITSPPDSYFNSGNPVVEIDQYDSAHDYGAFGFLIQVATKNAEATGEQIIASANGGGNVNGLVVNGQQGASGTAAAYGINAEAGNRGSGIEVALSASTDGHQSGANSLAILASSSTGAHIFEVRNDGSVHIKTGTAVIADL